MLPKYMAPVLADLAQLTSPESMPVAREPAENVTDVLICPAAEIDTVAVLNVCVLVHVGAIVWLNCGAASERMNVAAEPLTGVRPTEAEGFAPPALADAYSAVMSAFTAAMSCCQLMVVL